MRRRATGKVRGGGPLVTCEEEGYLQGMGRRDSPVRFGDEEPGVKRRDLRSGVVKSGH